MEDQEQPTKKSKPAPPVFRGSLQNVPQVAPEEHFNVDVTTYSPHVMELSLFQQFDSQLKSQEAAEHLKAKRKMAADKAAIRAKIAALEERHSETDNAKTMQKIEQQIEAEQAKLQKIRQEELAEQQLEQMQEKEQEKEEPQKDHLVSAGVLTPFEKERDAHAAAADFSVMRRKGTFVDDTDNAVFAERIRAWKAGADMMRVEEMIEEGDEEQEEEDDVVNLEALKNVEEEAEEDENEEEEEGEDEDALVFSADEDEDLPVVVDDDDDARCDRCSNMRGMKQVLEVLGKNAPEECEFDLPALLKGCRGNTQRALEMILGGEEELKAKYPRLGPCMHAESGRRRKKDVAQPSVPKRVKRNAPELLALPADVIEDLNAGKLASVVVEGDFRVPLETYDCLFEYQRTSIRWLWELHKQQVGGVLADEMGLGKTVQMISFLYGLYHSNMLSAPTLLVCPATVMKQWVSEFHKWAPPFRVMMLHSSNRGTGLSYSKDTGLLRALGARGGGVIVTTFEGFRRNKEALLPVKWGYAVLDEGHKIRNPDADISLTAKQLQTHHRVILTGTPIQNSLKELWSLMDFVYPGKLGTLPIFQREFEVPIQLGGYASASPSQVMTAFRCSVMLRDLIKPYLLRRLKADVDVALPDKTEQVMMCRLTPEQVKVYRTWIYSDEVKRILEGRLNALYGISFLRKICNHPDLLKLGQVLPAEEEQDFGNFRRSGKMLVLHEMLPVWKADGHRVLIFSQGVQMLNLIVSYLKQQGHKHLRMDGGTSVQSRIPLIDQFNSDPSIFVFVLTTRVGGIGVNLTGADRVVIFDPDWNPSTDVQARERAWRIGQQRKVCVYRLVTQGTIEEKVLHRQIYKTFLTQKVLSNPRQRRFFSGRDMADLFTLGNEYSGMQGGAATANSETHRIFADMHDKVAVEAPDAAPASRDNGEDRDDDVLLRTLLGRNDRVVSALNHEAMVGDQAPEYQILQQEANHVAQKAAASIRESQRQITQQPIHAPTWTGRRGEAGVTPRFGQTIASLRRGESGIRNLVAPTGGPGSTAAVRGQKRVLVSDPNLKAPCLPPPAGSSSRDVLASIRERKDRGQKQEESEEEMGRRLVRQITGFIWGNGGQCTSDEIIEEFQGRFETPEEKFSFRAILREVAELKRGMWKLKDDYVANKDV